MGRDTAHLNVRSKSNNNERKFLNLSGNHLSHCRKKIRSVITQVCKETKLWIHPNLCRPNFLLSFFTFSLS